MVDIIHRIGIKAPASKVYEALATVEGVGKWWTEETSGTSKLGGSVVVRFRSATGEEIGKMEFEPTRLTADKEVHWRFKSGPPEWVGTDVTFTLSQAGEYTLVIFGHRNWRIAA